MARVQSLVRGVLRATPTRRADWTRMWRAVSRAVRRPAGAGAALLGGVAYLSLFALPGNLAYVRLVVASSLPPHRTVTAVAALYPPFSPRFTALDATLVFVTCALVAANAAVLARAAVAGTGLEAGSGSALGAAGSLLGSGCAVCGSVVVPVAGLGAAVAALPLGGLELSLVSVAVLVLALAAASRPAACGTGDAPS